MLLLLVAATYLCARLAWADHLSRSNLLADREHAVALVSSAVFHQRLADLLEREGRDPLPDLMKAVELEPANPDRRIRLGLRAEVADQLAPAESSLLAAAARSRQYLPRYLLAGYYFRRQNADLFWRWSREAFHTSYGDVTPLLDLSWRMSRDVLVRESLEMDPRVADQSLVFLARHQTTSSVRALAVHLAQGAKPEDLPALLAYCDEGLATAATDGPVEVWNILCRRGLVAGSELDPPNGRSLTNSAFAHTGTGRAFDWRVESAPSFHWRFEDGLQLTFSGTQPERCMIGWQYLPLVRGARYLVPAPRIKENDTHGLQWEIYDVTGKPLTANRNSDGSLAFEAPAAALRLVLFYQRPSGVVRLAGRITVQEASLEKQP